MCISTCDVKNYHKKLTKLCWLGRNMICKRKAGSVKSYQRSSHGAIERKPPSCDFWMRKRLTAVKLRKDSVNHQVCFIRIVSFRWKHHTDVTLPSHCRHTAVTLISYPYCTSITAMSQWCHTDVTPKSHQHHINVTRMLHDTLIALASHQRHTDFTLMGQLIVSFKSPESFFC